MAEFIPTGAGLGARLGGALGGGIAQDLGQALDVLAQVKLQNQLQQRQQSQMFQNLTNLGIQPNVASLISTLPSDLQKAAFQNLGSLAQLQAPQMQGQQTVPQGLAPMQEVLSQKAPQPRLMEMFNP
jgi:hypothetical protein